MSKSYDYQSTQYARHPAYAAPRQAIQAPDGTIYTNAPAEQQLYVRDPYAAVQNQPMLPSATQSTLTSWIDISNAGYLKGLVVGVGATLLVTNPTVQSAVVKGAVAAWGAVVGGLEEIKERIRDVKAEQSME